MRRGFNFNFHLMLLDIIFLIGGLVLILWGADWLTDGASSLARRWGVSDLVTGLTVVAFGTSAPELAISILSAVDGSTGLAVGNVVGSNIFNILVIIGITALIRPMTVAKSVMNNDLPLVILSAVALLAVGLTPVLDPGAPDAVTRVEGILLILFFVIYMRYMFASAKGASADDPAAKEGAGKKIMPMWKSVVWIVVGLAALVGGGQGFVDGASGIASGLGVSDTLIGLTIVAAGTSLPELATSITAALKGSPGMAIGNVIGSCIFNIFLVLGLTAVIQPLPFGDVSLFDLLTMTVASLLFFFFGWKFGDKIINRWEGALLFLCYLAYITVKILQI